MSYFPLSTLNVKHCEVLVGANDLISGVGTVVALNSIAGSTDKVSLSGNTITLKHGVDYFITTSIIMRSTASNAVLDASISTLYRLGFYDTTNGMWLIQKCTNPTNTHLNSAKNAGIRDYQAYCVIPSQSTDIDIQLRIKSQAETLNRLTIHLDNANTDYGNSAIIIYHN
jgi:hypothetical protein